MLYDTPTQRKEKERIHVSAGGLGWENPDAGVALDLELLEV